MHLSWRTLTWTRKYLGPMLRMEVEMKQRWENLSERLPSSQNSANQPVRVARHKPLLSKMYMITWLEFAKMPLKHSPGTEFYGRTKPRLNSLAWCQIFHLEETRRYSSPGQVCLWGELGLLSLAWKSLCDSRLLSFTNDKSHCVLQDL